MQNTRLNSEVGMKIGLGRYTHSSMRIRIAEHREEPYLAAKPGKPPGLKANGGDQQTTIPGTLDYWLWCCPHSSASRAHADHGDAAVRTAHTGACQSLSCVVPMPA